MSSVRPMRRSTLGRAGAVARQRSRTAGRLHCIQRQRLVRSVRMPAARPLTDKRLHFSRMGHEQFGSNDQSV
jgi:hypothetical protein